MARIRSCMLNDVQCSLMWSPHDLYEGDCVVDCTSISQKLFVWVVALSTGSLVHFYMIHRIRKKENWMCSQTSHKKQCRRWHKLTTPRMIKHMVPNLFNKQSPLKMCTMNSQSTNCLWILQVMLSMKTIGVAFPTNHCQTLISPSFVQISPAITCLPLTMTCLSLPNMNSRGLGMQ